MPGRWDTSTKRLVNTRPEDFIRWLMPKAEFLGPVEAKALNLNNQEIEFASLALVKETDRNWLQRRFRMFEDALKDSWAYQEIWQGGKQEGIELGKREGKREGLLEGIQLGKLEGMKEEQLADAQRQRDMLGYVIETKFPALLPLAKKRGEASDDPDVLQALTFRLLRAESEQEARQILSQGS